jgi:hypothetical protein
MERGGSPVAKNWPLYAHPSHHFIGPKKIIVLSVLNSTYQRKKETPFLFIRKKQSRLVARDVMHMFGFSLAIFCLQYRCFT